MLALWIEEADAPPGFYDANLLASELKFSTPPIQKIIKALTSHGFQATRTHFNPNGFKTLAKFDDIAQILKSMRL